jgi:tetratricopeptide (TPR) repeat protein
MFFSKFFRKNAQQLREQGDTLFKEGRFADARHLYMEAVEKLSSSDSNDEDITYLRTMISRSSNSLAELNIIEADASIRSGNYAKGEEHLNLALELADDVSVREKADELISRINGSQSTAAVASMPTGSHGCSSCNSAHHAAPEPAAIQPDHLLSHEQFQLLVNTLPGDLPQRYSAMGEKFASAYLIAHSENPAEALEIFHELMSHEKSDILMYEAALLYFRGGDYVTCEQLLKKALSVNGTNPVCCLSLAQLYTESKRFDEAISLLNLMSESQILSEQALIMLADVHAIKGDAGKAIEILGKAIEIPVLKKASAERLVRLLASEGREDEASFVAKNYLKGCC